MRTTRHTTRPPRHTTRPAGLLPRAAAVVAITAALAGCDQVYRTTPAPPAMSAPPAAMGTAVLEGVNAAEDVSASATTTDAQGRPVTRVAVFNSSAQRHDYSFSVAFRFSPGTDTMEAVNVSVLGVDPGAHAFATVTGTRRLTSGSVAVINNAVRSCG